VTRMSFRQFSAVSWVQRWPSTHQSHGNGDETQDVLESDQSLGSGCARLDALGAEALFESSRSRL